MVIEKAENDMLHEKKNLRTAWTITMFFGYPKDGYLEVVEETTNGRAGPGAGGNGGAGGVALEMEETTNVKRGAGGKEEQSVTKRKMEPIPPNVCLFEEWNMHVRENRF